MRISDWSSDVCSSDLLCAKAANTDNGKRYAVLECFQRLPKTLPKELRADLCRGTTSVGPADCFRAANMVADVEDRVKFCRDAPDKSRIQCFANCTRLSIGLSMTTSHDRTARGLSFCCNEIAVER